MRVCHMKRESHQQKQPVDHDRIDLARLQFFEEQRGNHGILNNHFFGDAASASRGSADQDRPVSAGPDGVGGEGGADPLPQ